MTILGFGTSSRCVGNERVGVRFDPSQPGIALPPRCRPLVLPGARKRIVSANIENNEAQPLCTVDGFAEPLERNRLVLGVPIVRKRCVHWNEIIDALDLNPMAGIIHYGNI